MCLFAAFCIYLFELKWMNKKRNLVRLSKFIKIKLKREKTIFFFVCFLHLFIWLKIGILLITTKYVDSSLCEQQYKCIFIHFILLAKKYLENMDLSNNFFFGLVYYWFKWWRHCVHLIPPQLPFMSSYYAHYFSRHACTDTDTHIQTPTRHPKMCHDTL